MARIPKDLTRTNSRLLAWRRSQGVLMLEPKTYYEQVPLEIVRKIVKEQLRREITIEQDQGTEKEKLEEDFSGGQEN
jgi:hypothetical protein